jgi:hypothetical protein
MLLLKWKRVWFSTLYYCLVDYTRTVNCVLLFNCTSTNIFSKVHNKLCFTSCYCLYNSFVLLRKDCKSAIFGFCTNKESIRVHRTKFLDFYLFVIVYLNFLKEFVFWNLNVVVKSRDTWDLVIWLIMLQMSPVFRLVHFGNFYCGMLTAYSASQILANVLVYLSAF